MGQYNWPAGKGKAVESLDLAANGGVATTTYSTVAHEVPAWRRILRYLCEPLQLPFSIGCVTLAYLPIGPSAAAATC